MRTLIIDAESPAQALSQAPWATSVREVDDGNGGVAYMVFESNEEAEQWDNQE